MRVVRDAFFYGVSLLLPSLCHFLLFLFYSSSLIQSLFLLLLRTSQPIQSFLLRPQKWPQVSKSAFSENRRNENLASGFFKCLPPLWIQLMVLASPFPPESHASNGTTATQPLTTRPRQPAPYLCNKTTRPQDNSCPHYWDI